MSDVRRAKKGQQVVSLFSSCLLASSVTQFRFPLGGGRQGILFRLDGTLARLLHPSGLSGVEFNVRSKLGRNFSLGVDGVHGTFVHASHAIYALLRVNNQLTLQLIKARHRAYQHAVGELAPQTFIGNDMRHKLFLFQVNRAYESRLDQRCGFANAFWENGHEGKKWRLDPGRGGRIGAESKFNRKLVDEKWSQIQSFDIRINANRDKRSIPFERARLTLPLAH